MIENTRSARRGDGLTDGQRRATRHGQRPPAGAVAAAPRSPHPPRLEGEPTEDGGAQPGFGGGEGVAPARIWCACQPAAASIRLSAVGARSRQKQMSLGGVGRESESRLALRHRLDDDRRYPCRYFTKPSLFGVTLPRAGASLQGCSALRPGQKRHQPCRSRPRPPPPKASPRRSRDRTDSCDPRAIPEYPDNKGRQLVDPARCFFLSNSLRYEPLQGAASFGIAWRRGRAPLHRRTPARSSSSSSLAPNSAGRLRASKGEAGGVWRTI